MAIFLAEQTPRGWGFRTSGIGLARARPFAPNARRFGYRPGGRRRQRSLKLVVAPDHGYAATWDA